jgi:signal transduction histidine kinase
LKSKQTVFVEQLNHACRLTGCGWGIYAAKILDSWDLILSTNREENQEEAISTFINSGKIKRWLDKLGEKTRSGYRSAGERKGELGVERVYAFSTGSSKRLLLVGVDDLTSEDREYFESFATLAPKSVHDMHLLSDPPVLDFEGLSLSLDLSDSLRGILESFCTVLEVGHAFLALRVGDEFFVNAALNLPDEILNANFDFPDFEKYEGGERKEMAMWEERLPFELRKTDLTLPEVVWLFIPLVIGQRLIGAVVCGREKEFSEAEIKEAVVTGQHISLPVEKNILYVEAAYYLQRFALLNELASLASSGMSMYEVIRRSEAMLAQAFGAKTTQILLLDREKNRFWEYVDKYDNDSGYIIRSIETSTSMEKSVVEIGQPLRIDNIERHSRYVASGSDVAAKMVVPMSFRGKVVGVVSLESDEEGLFSEDDEKFMAVIASQLASILESIRLNSEMRQRAQDMQRVNETVQVILELEAIKDISEGAAALMAEKFGYEMVLVMLLDESMGELVAEGMAGYQVAEVPKNFRFSKDLGIQGEVIRYGESVLLTDVEEAGSYVPIPGWEPGCGIWVPLHDGPNVFGVISVEYQQKYRVNENDLSVLEAIGGALSSVLITARQYTQLQVNVRQLEAVRETALDISTDLDLEFLLRRVVNRVRTLVDARGAELGFIESNKEAVEVLVSENPWQSYKGYRFPFMSGVTGRVAAIGEPLAIADFNAWSGRGESAFKAPFTTVAGVPLKLSGEIIGTLVVQDDRPARAFTHDDIRTLELLAPQLAIFIRNARLYQELEERMDAQRLAEERLVRSAKLAAVGEMAAAVAHELNNPLTTVTGFAELILETLDEDSPEYDDMSLVLSEAQRSREVVRRLLDFSRQSDILRGDTDMNEIITMVLQLVHHQAQTGNVKVRMELWDDIPLIRADRNQMQQVLLNLVHNAIQAMPEGGELVVRSLMEKWEDLNWLGIMVKDTGEGIEEEALDQIFEPFYTTKPTGEGTGLGLSVSYSIVSEHGGYIEVASTVGEGSEFIIWLPTEQEG